MARSWENVLAILPGGSRGPFPLPLVLGLGLVACGIVALLGEVWVWECAGVSVILVAGMLSKVDRQMREKRREDV